MTLRQVSKVLGIKVRTIRSWVKKGKIKAVKVRNHWEIPEDEIYNEEVLKRADKGREHSKRIKEGIELGMLQRAGQNPEEPV